jgi:hypothetical protein
VAGEPEEEPTDPEGETGALPEDETITVTDPETGETIVCFRDEVKLTNQEVREKITQLMESKPETEGVPSLKSLGTEVKNTLKENEEFLTSLPTQVFRSFKLKNSTKWVDKCAKGKGAAHKADRIGACRTIFGDLTYLYGASKNEKNFELLKGWKNAVYKLGLEEEEVKQVNAVVTEIMDFYPEYFK